MTDEIDLLKAEVLRAQVRDYEDVMRHRAASEANYVTECARTEARHLEFVEHCNRMYVEAGAQTQAMRAIRDYCSCFARMDQSLARMDQHFRPDDEE